MPRCTDCGQLRTLAELYPNKGICDQCMSNPAFPKPEPQKVVQTAREDQVPMSINRLFDNEDAWLDDEPWRRF